MIKSHLNAISPEEYKSDVALFGFNKKDEHLRVSFKEFKRSLYPIERVNVFLNDGRVLKNIFIVYDNYFYYYEKDSYYEHGKEDYPKAPSKNILRRFDIKIDDIDLIISNNNQRPPISGFLSLFNSLEKYISKEVLVKIHTENEISKYHIDSLIYKSDFIKL